MRFPLLCVILFLSTNTLMCAQDTETNFSTGPQYLLTGSPLFARPISTPTLSLNGPPLQTGAANATEGLVAGAEDRTTLPQPSSPPDLFLIYYGKAWTNAFGITTEETSVEPILTELSVGPLDTGVDQISVAQLLRDRGNEVAFGAIGVYKLADAQHAARVYTNADISRLRGAS